MRTSAICRSSVGRRPSVGFTLLELMVVLTLLGLIAALAAPNLQRLYSSLIRATERDLILDQIAELGREAMLRGRDYVLLDTAGLSEGSGPVPPLGYEAYPLDVPLGWHVRLEEPLFVRANGVCLGGALTLHHAESAPFRLELRAPYCRIDPGA